LTFRLADPEGRYAAVRLCSDLPLSDAERTFARDGDAWVLTLDVPQLARLEYELEVEDADGDRVTVADPGNPLRAPGAFGEKSVMRAEGYEEPAWLTAPAVTGTYEAFAIRGRGLGASVEGRVWSPADSDPAEPLPLLVAHDGPEYDALASLTRFAGTQIAAGALPPHRVALLAPGPRDEWYSASALYSRALYVDVIPGLPAVVAGAPVGMGASLGALAMLVAQRRAPHTFAALFLQSGSFFVPRLDSQESGFSRYARIVRVVRAMRKGSELARPIPVALTCGSTEENVFNNRVMARALAEQGYDARLDEVPDRHNYTAWRDALDPHLVRLLAKVWT
jgi:enterochelin esterase family protein